MNPFLSKQYPNLILWMPFIMAAGMIAYFVWPTEPVIAAPFLISVLCAITFVFVHRSFKRDKISINYYLSLVTFLLFGFGFFYAAASTRNMATPTIPRDLREISVAGTVESIDYTSERTRVYVKVMSNANPLYSDKNETSPLQIGTVVRLSLKSEEPIPKIGDAIETTATLFKPLPATAPGGFDMAEFAYFKGFGGIGYPTADIGVIENASKNNIGDRMSVLRDKIHARIAAHDNKAVTALVDSLVLGHGRAIDPAESDAARAAGIAHIFSISGFHLTLIGGWFFAFFYLLLRAIQPLTRRFPARIPALICTWVALLFYLSISGAAVATQRSFIMATLAFSAMLFSRTILSLRNVCLVFGALLLINPHYVMEIGFQLSFAAIFGLTYFFSGRKYEDLTRIQKIRRAIVGAIMATVAATIFTEPIIAYHFHSVQVYTLLGNLVIVPLFSILIMPLVIIGTIMGAIFGWFLPLDIGAYAYDLVMQMTGWIASLPHAMIFVPRIPGVAMALFVIAALVFMFIVRETKREKMATYGVVAFILFLITFSLFLLKRPIFYASHDHELVAFMTDGGKLQFNKKSSTNNKMAFNSWDALNGDGASSLRIKMGSEDLPPPRKSIRKGFDGVKYRATCEDKVCVYETKNWRLSYIQQFVPLYKNIERLCDAPTQDLRSEQSSQANLSRPHRFTRGQENIDFIVTYFKIDAPNCKAEILRGGFVIFEDGRIEYVQSNRLWHK